MVDKVKIDLKNFIPKNPGKEKEKITLGVAFVSEKDDKLFIKV